MISVLLLAVSLAGSTCAAEDSPDAPCPEARAPADWRMVATEDDRRRVREWRDAWTEALDQARGAGHAADISREGPLLDPDAALGDPMPPPGDYDCRTIKVGSPPTGLLSYIAYPAFHCRITVAGESAELAKLTGSQRPIGRLFADNDRRRVFLGTMQLGDEQRAPFNMAPTRTAISPASSSGSARTAGGWSFPIRISNPCSTSSNSPPGPPPAKEPPE